VVRYKHTGHGALQKRTKTTKKKPVSDREAVRVNPISALSKKRNAMAGFGGFLRVDSREYGIDPNPGVRKLLSTLTVPSQKRD